MTAPSRSAPRSFGVTLPLGFIELTIRQQPRHAYWERELTELYPELDRVTRAELVSALESIDIPGEIDDLGDLGDDDISGTRVFAALVFDGTKVEGVVLLVVDVTRLPVDAAGHDLLDGFNTCLEGRPDLRLRQLPCRRVVAGLAEHTDEPDELTGEPQRVELFLADRTLPVLTTVSAYCAANGHVDLTPTLTEIAETYQPA